MLVQVYISADQTLEKLRWSTEGLPTRTRNPVTDARECVVDRVQSELLSSARRPLDPRQTTFPSSHPTHSTLSPPHTRAAITRAQELSGPPVLLTRAPAAAIADPLSAAPAAPAAPPRGPCDLALTFFPPSSENSPASWSAEAQQGAGNSRADHLLKIALAGYPIPNINVAPISVFTQVGGAVPAGCVTGEAGAAAGVLVKPAVFTVSWSLADKSGKVGPFVKGSKQDPPANVSLAHVPDLTDVSGADLVAAMGRFESL